MKKSYLGLGCLLFSSLLSAQSRHGASSGTNGFVLVKEFSYQTSPASATIVDAGGKFIYNMYDLNGNHSKHLFVYDEQAGEWVKKLNDIAIENVKGPLDMNHQLNPGNEVAAIYWKDDGNTYWCVSTTDKVNSSINPSSFSEAVEKGIKIKEDDGNESVILSIPIGIE